MVRQQVWWGVGFIVAGIALEFIPIIGWIYGTILLLIGIFLIIFRNAESEIEPIKEGKK